MWAVQGILAALYERQRTGKGRLVECSLLETAIGFSSWTSAQWLADHEEPTRQGSRHRLNAPYQRMQTICERPGFGRGPAYPHPGQNRR
jgi:crotonobetainyl-CoA:carnitine CoA-transferase CaiB-like acyl-CoA transferase